MRSHSSNSRRWDRPYFPGIVAAFFSVCCLLHPPAVGSGVRGPVVAQTFTDSSEISRDLLYHPARVIESSDSALLLRGARFTYRFDRGTHAWQVRAEDNSALLPPEAEVDEYESERLSALFQFFGETDGEEAVLEIHRSLNEAGFEVIARLPVWNRARLAEAWLDYFREDSPELTAAQLAEDLTVARPEVAAVADDGRFLWLAIRHYTGEGALGLGTVVRLDTTTNDTKIFQPAELGTSSITHVAAFADAIWLGAHLWGEGYTEPTAGLVRMSPKSGALESYRSGKTAGFAGHVVTALAIDAGALWVGTDEGICRLGTERSNWECWRIVPTVTLAGPVPVSDFPGGPATRRLPPGSYEVRWATAVALEVVTPNPVEGWARDEEVADFEARGFHSAAYELTNTYAGGAGVLRLLPTHVASPLEAAQVIRAPVERVGQPESDGWQRCRAGVGWISREGQDVVPQILPVSQQWH